MDITDSRKIFTYRKYYGEFVRIYLSVQKDELVNSSSIVITDLAIATFSLLLIAIFSLSVVLGF